MKNPYAWNTVNPDLFYGRDDIWNDFLTGLPGVPRCSFGLAGGRRMGKSTILRRIEGYLKAGVEQWREIGLLVIPVYVDGLALPRPLTPPDVWSCILEQILSLFPEQLAQAPRIPDFNLFKETLKPIFAALPEEPRVIVLFDEVEAILECDWAEGFLANWRALLSNSPDLSKYFTAVFAGAKEISALQHDITSPLADILEWRSLQVLDYEDACLLMQEPIEKVWPESFLKRAYKETGGHPMLLQYIMQHISSSSSEDSENLLDRVIAKFEREQHRQFHQWWNKYCSLLAQKVYARLPADSASIPLRELTRDFGSSGANDALEILQHVGLVTRNEDDLTFCYTGEMFQRWYRGHVALPEPQPEELEALIKKGEGEQLEFKETAFLKREWKKKDPSETDKVVKTIAAFLNSDGGDLLIGVNDKGEVLGIEEDIKVADNKKPNKDGYELALRQKLSNGLGGENGQSYTFTFPQIEEKIVCRISVLPADRPVYYDGELYVRNGNISKPLNAREAIAYKERRFPNH